MTDAALPDYTSYVLAAYGVAAVLLVALVAASLVARARARKDAP